jgi:hypothetical protein
MEAVTLLVVLWCVYLSEILWWTSDDRLILIGRRIGAFHGQYGPTVTVREGRGFYIPSFAPPFPHLFECQLGDGLPSRLAARGLVERRVKAALAAAAPLRRLGAGLWIYVFIVAPAVIVLFGLRATWPFLLALLALWLLATILTYRRSWSRLYPEKPGDWSKDAFLMAFSPLGAPRAADRLTRGALDGLTAMRIASVVAPRDEFCRLARLVYFDSRARQETRQEIDHILEAEGWAAAFAAPPAAEPGMKGFCPRCCGQLLCDSGGCPDCAGVSIRPFAHSG